jgi:hypothetical protein
MPERLNGLSKGERYRLSKIDQSYSCAYPYGA